MNKNRKVQPLSENTRKAIIIAAIVVVAVIILSISLALILRPATLTPDDESSSSSGSSSLPIKNSDFAYTSSDDESLTFPKAAQNWEKYAYQKATGSSHDFESIINNDKASMGIVDISDWATVESDLAGENLTGIKNPGPHDGIKDGKDDNNNVYMIATKEATTASIMSASASVSSGASVKITVWLNTAQLQKDSEAVIMIQKSTVRANKTNWYAYDFHIGQQEGWQKFEFHIFNREASTKYIRVCIGIGNVYSGEEGLPLVGKNKDQPITGEGVLFIDDITYETVTANEYRKVVDEEGAENSTMFKIIENEDIVEKSQYLELQTETASHESKLTAYNDSSELKADGWEYFPFTDRDDFYVDNQNGKNETLSGFKIYQFTHDGTDVEAPLTLRLNAAKLGSSKGDNGGINVKSSLLLKDHHHLSFWVRVDQENKAAYANVYVQSWVGGTEGWKDLDSGSWKVITTSQDIENDSNCGWVKYDIYLKPTASQQEISILFVLGKNGTYTEKEIDRGVIPNGTMYVTSPAYEKIAYSDYNSASSGSYVKKLDLVGTSASTTITNGSFSSLDSTGRQPSNWTPAFGGDNAIFRDGQENVILGDKRLAYIVEGSGTVQAFNEAISSKGKSLDDDQRNVLKIVNNEETSFGYYSTNITLSARTAYVISVAFKGDGNPFMYVIDANTEGYEATEEATVREQRILASVTGPQTVANTQLFGYYYGNDKLENGWARYFMVIVTGKESMSVRLALFNGSIDGETTLKTGTVYYDQVEMHTLGTYSFVKGDDDDKEANPDYDYDTYYKVQWTNHTYITKTTTNNALYGENFGELLKKTVSEEDDTLLLESWGIKITTQPSEEEWKEMTLIPEETEAPEEDDTTDPTETESNDVNLGFLFSVISSVALVAVLLVVFVVKVYKNKGRTSRAA